MQLVEQKGLAPAETPPRVPTRSLQPGREPQAPAIAGSRNTTCSSPLGSARLGQARASWEAAGRWFGTDRHPGRWQSVEHHSAELSARAISRRRLPVGSHALASFAEQQSERARPRRLDPLQRNKPAALRPGVGAGLRSTAHRGRRKLAHGAACQAERASTLPRQVQAL